MMARPKNTIPNEIIFDVKALWERIKDMDSVTLGKYIRKAFDDMQNGCIAKDTDEFIKEQYNRSLAEMVRKQNKQARKYQNRRARKNAENSNGDVVSIPETEAIAHTTNALDVAPESSRFNKSAKSNKNAYGPNKNVMLTDEEGAHLRELYGEDLKMAIDILDAYIENGGKKAKNYKDHAAVMRRGNWVWNKVQETKLAEKRLENANRPANVKSFKQADRDERTRFFMDTSVVDRMIENESKAI